MYKIYFSLSIVIIMFITHFSAQAENASDISITDAYIRASIPGTSNSSAYMRINNNNEKTVTLIKVSSKISPRIEIHNHVMKNDMMHMQQLEQLDIAANSHALFQPHGLHLMFFSLTEPLNVKSVVEITLHFSDKRTVTVSLPVKSLK